jgi:predicted nuclease of predicted toxin-antitoxin system
MTLLFDQNLSPRLPALLADLYPHSVHARDVGLRDSTDTEVWDYAGQHGFAIVSKDSDFQQRSLVYGHPPKFVWLRVGNCPTRTIEVLLRRHSIAIHAFYQDPVESHLMLP